MQRTPENLVWAIETLSQLFHLRNAPREDNQKEALAKAFLKIVDDDKPAPFEVDPKGKEERVLFVPRHYTCQQTVDWLMEALWEDNEGEFPSMRVIADTYVKGKEDRWGDVEEVKRMWDVRS